MYCYTVAIYCYNRTAQQSRLKKLVAIYCYKVNGSTEPLSKICLTCKPQACYDMLQHVAIHCNKIIRLNIAILSLLLLLLYTYTLESYIYCIYALYGEFWKAIATLLHHHLYGSV